MFIERGLEKTIIASLSKYPVVGLIGCRQVGKTTLAKTLQEKLRKKIIYLDLELPSDLAKLQEPELYLSRFTEHLVIIDEMQYMPSLFTLIRALVDKERAKGRFLILGSASPELIKQASESLAGRIIYHELTPFVINEAGFKNINTLWLRGGFPISYLAEDNNESLVWRETFIRTYLERDIPQLGIHVPAANLRRFWTMLAHSHGQLWNASQIARGLGLSAPTVKNYLDILEETFIVRQVQPYYFNIKKRLIKSPKVYIRDSGLLHALLRIKTFDDMQAHPVIGSSWEGFVIEQITGMLPQNTPIYFYRTGAGAEIDLLLFDSKNRPIAIEIKYSLSPKIEKGFYVACEDLSCKKGFVVYPGEESYPISKNVYMLPLKEIARIID
ncbi:MAG: ATP-binding protein [Nitrospirae bacterium]|nr:ATP-binding protein [Nitrospirota bacterium]